jgi:hypothetical protein
MLIRLNRFTALILLLLLAPIVIPIKLFRRLTGSNKKPEYSSTIRCDPLTYAGDPPLVVAVWATWASVWKIAIAQIMSEMQTEFAGKCEFMYIEGTARGGPENYGAAVLPAVLVFHGGREVARFINLIDANKLRQSLSDLTNKKTADVK